MLKFMGPEVREISERLPSLGVLLRVAGVPRDNPEPAPRKPIERCIIVVRRNDQHKRFLTIGKALAGNSQVIEDMESGGLERWIDEHDQIAKSAYVRRYCGLWRLGGWWRTN